MSNRNTRPRANSANRQESRRVRTSTTGSNRDIPAAFEPIPFDRDELYRIDLDHIVDDKERAEAYKTIANQLNKFHIEQRGAHLTQTKENENQIRYQETLLDEIRVENLALREQLIAAIHITEQIPKEMELKHIVSAIPVFDGKRKQLDSFISTCEIYISLVAENQKDNLLKVIKAKLIGDALIKTQPLEGINTWAALKERIKTAIKTRVSYEYAQDLNNVIQWKDESVEKFSERVREKLRVVLESMTTPTNTEAEKVVMRKCMERLAISKFSQNLRSNNLKILVSASGKTSLDECITFALEKELLEKGRNQTSCGICGLSNHTDLNCRRKKPNPEGKSNNFRSGNSNINNKGTTSSPGSTSNPVYKPKNSTTFNPNNRPNPSFNSNFNSNANTSASFQNNSNRVPYNSQNNRNRPDFYDQQNEQKRNVRTFHNDEDMTPDSTVQEVIDLEEEESHSKN